MTVERVLGTGASSFVYAVRHAYFSDSVAVKVLRPRDASHALARDWLRREAEIYARVADPRIPQAYFVDQLSDGSPYIAMELISGLTVRALLSRGPLAPRPACALVVELLGILDKVHARGVFHRDIKPSNLVLSRRGDDKYRLYLLDFGLARTEDALDTRVAAAPELAGTPSYMAPEVLSGSVADARSDLYAVGVLLYQALTGSLPHGRACTMDVVNAILYETPTPLLSLAPGVPSAVVDITQRAMAKLPTQRFQSALEMQRALALTV
jgi:serine/threonine-protein kinase